MRRRVGSASAGRENLCDAARFTGYQLDGGFAEHTVADERFCFPLPARYDDEHAAPLLCAGLIGWRALRAAGDGRRSASTASAPRRTSSPRSPCSAAVSRRLHPARRRRRRRRSPARSARVGGRLRRAAARPPRRRDHLRPGRRARAGGAARRGARAARVVCAGIHMSDIPSFPYADLWGERRIVSVANLTRADGVELLELAGRLDIRTTTTAFPLSAADEALDAVRHGRLHGCCGPHAGPAVLAGDMARALELIEGALAPSSGPRSGRRADRSSPWCVPAPPASGGPSRAGRRQLRRRRRRRGPADRRPCAGVPTRTPCSSISTGRRSISSGCAGHSQTRSTRASSSCRQRAARPTRLVVDALDAGAADVVIGASPAVVDARIRVALPRPAAHRPAASCSRSATC